MTFYRLSKIAGRYNRDLAPLGIDKCEKNTIAFMGDDCIGKGLDF